MRTQKVEKIAKWMVLHPSSDGWEYATEIAKTATTEGIEKLLRDAEALIRSTRETLLINWAQN